MSSQPYHDPSLPVEERVADLLARMTLEEKAGQLTQYFYLNQNPGQQAGPGEDAARLSAVDEALANGRVGSLLFVRTASESNRLQRVAIEGHRLRIPVLFGYDVIHGLRTGLPVPIALAASWDPQIIEAGQTVAAREARAVGIHWAFAPMVDIARDPRWGRIVEGAGEDPCLGSAVAAAQVRGLQGDLGPERVLAGPKHFAGYGAALGGRDYDDSDISDSQLWNLYLPPFQAAVEAGAENIMSAYMDLNGIPASANRWLLTDVLRDRFGFQGFVVSDADAVRSLHTQHFARDLADAGVRALSAGLDLEMCFEDPAFSRLPDAVRAGRVSEEQLDQAVRRVLSIKFRLGLFEKPYVDEEAAEATVNRADHRETARVAAEKTLVLLTNTGVLPLAAPRSVAVLGPLADSPRDLLGPWIFDYNLTESVTILEGIRRRAGAGVEVRYAPGALPGERLYPSMFDAQDQELMVWPENFDAEAELARAAQLARDSEVAVVVVGQSQNMIGERACVSTLELPGRQQELLEAVVATGTPTVVLVMSGRPLQIGWAAEQAAAVMQVWYPGVRGGEAVAAALYGDCSPAGRLPFTWPRSVGQLPMVYNHYRTFQPEAQHERYWDAPSTPLFCFGHGLSYADIRYQNLRLDPPRIAVGGTTTALVDVTNTSGRETDEGVQLYIHQRYGHATWPLRELKGFQRITLAPGQTRTVRLPLGPQQLRYWSADCRDWVLDATTIDVWVGGSSAADLRTELMVG